jgi:hypothetical protein
MKRVQNRYLRQILDDDINRKLGVEKENSCFVIPSLKITAEAPTRAGLTNWLAENILARFYLYEVLPRELQSSGPNFSWSIYEKMHFSAISFTSENSVELEL